MAFKSKILIVGGSGYVGKFMVEASAKAGHPTYVLLRYSTLSNHSKSHIINNFKTLGVHFLFVSLFVFIFFLCHLARDFSIL
ncbi:hypothetical protein IC575_001479 [Cucumis melo]